MRIDVYCEAGVIVQRGMFHPALMQDLGAECTALTSNLFSGKAIGGMSGAHVTGEVSSRKLDTASIISNAGLVATRRVLEILAVPRDVQAIVARLSPHSAGSFFNLSRYLRPPLRLVQANDDGCFEYFIDVPPSIDSVPNTRADIKAIPVGSGDLLTQLAPLDCRLVNSSNHLSLSLLIEKPVEVES